MMLKIGLLLKNSFRIALPVILIIFILTGSVPVFADEAFVIDNYDVVVKANSDNTFSISEKITVDFSLSRHGIFRSIPKRGGETPYTISIVKVKNEDFTIEPNLDFKIVKIGDKNAVIKGKKTYELSYILDFQNDKDKSKDFVYLNVIGNMWDTKISHAKVIFEFPSPNVSPEKYKVFIGKYGDTDETRADVVKNSNSIIITAKDTLNNFEGITLNAQFKEGTFHQQTKPFTFISIIIGMFLLIMSIALFVKFGRDKTLSPSIEFYPPDNLSSGSLGYIIDRVVQPLDISSMLLYWASHNHLKFTAFSEDDFSIETVSPLDSLHPEWEIKAFELLVLEIEKSGGSITKSELQTIFYKIASKIKYSIPMFFRNDNSLDDPKASNMSRFSSTISSLWLGVFAGIVAFTMYQSFFAALISIFVVTSAFFGFFGVLNLMVNSWQIKTLAAKIGAVFLTITFSIVAIGISIIASIESPVQLVAVVFATAVTITTQVVSVFINKRSDYGQLILERVLGFKEFLIVAEKDRLEALLKDNPEYYYNILPFALVLKVSDIWAEKFKDIPMQEPSWYGNTYGGNLGAYLMLRSFAYNTANSLSSYTAPPSTTGKGSGFSGGGFSGGGGGGGGGGSW